VKVWCVFDRTQDEYVGELIGVCLTESVARAVMAAEHASWVTDRDLYIEAIEVVVMPPELPPPRRAYQVIP
jgi:hypothetical protein